MANFDIDKRGYVTTQVDSFIDKLTLRYEEKLSEQKDRVFALKNEVTLLNDRLENYQNKDKQISKALIMAVEKAEQIENNAKRIYDLEVRRIRILYQNWKEILDMLDNHFPNILTNGKLHFLLTEFEENVSSVIRQNEKIENTGIKQEVKKNSDNYIKNLLNRMDYVINDKSYIKKPSKTVEELEKDFDAKQKREEARRKNAIKQLPDFSEKLVEETSPTADNFLKDLSIDLENTVYSKNIAPRPKKLIEPNESGFDFEEILTPKEELDEIMKIFDFYNNEDE